MTTQGLDQAFLAIGKLAVDYRAHHSSYVAPDYSEAQVRKDFIDKFFIALGWDVNHETQTNPFEQEVKVERPVAMGAAKRRADYAFHIAPNFRDPRLLVEAKKPSGEIKTADNYFQAVRYGWNKQSPLVGLTNFEELHLLDCRYKPDIDRSIQMCVEKFQIEDYLDREKFAKLYWLFSREAVAAGALEKYAKTLPKAKDGAKQRGQFAGAYKSIDESFLEDLDEYRLSLARAFKSRNPELDSETLTEVTQRTLDRLVFMRFLEDKLIEPSYFVTSFGERGTAWSDFVSASRRLDKIYNGIVFKQHGVLDKADFPVDDDAFARICEGISNRNSPYDFNAIPIHILGSIYERFLGNVIVATEKRAKVEPKPEVRKAGGVYYTPDYIVRYIVENTVGKLIEGKTPEKIAEMRFADIACGSGSFLLGVYDLLLQYHAKYYTDHPTKARKGECVTKDGILHLSLEKKREILLNNIYGVDIDPQAVEVTQFSLYLKLLDEETIASTSGYQQRIHAAILPSLNKNIVCGNSLIGTDILEGKLFDTDEERKLNPMDFKDAFTGVIKRGGFDAVVGNPPYVQIENIRKNEKRYFIGTYGEDGKLGKRYDIYQVFVLRALSLLRVQGRFGYILPNTFLMGHSYSILRKRIHETVRIEQCVDLPQGVFKGVTVDNVLLFLIREPDVKIRNSNTINIYKLAAKSEKSRVDSRSWDESFTIAQKSLNEDDDFKLNVHANPKQVQLFRKIEAISVRLGEVTESSQGIILYKTEADSLKSKYTSATRQTGWKRLLRGKNIGRYETKWRGEYVSYGAWLWCARDEKFFARPKILLHAMRNKSLARRLVATHDDAGYYNAHNLANIIAKDNSTYDLKYILACFNSTLLNFWYKAHFPNVNINPNDFRQLPIRRLDAADIIENYRDKLIGNVDSILEARKQFVIAKSDRDRNYYEARCATLDRQIDELVYELYGLSVDEVKIVEETDNT